MTDSWSPSTPATTAAAALAPPRRLGPWAVRDVALVSGVTLLSQVLSFASQVVFAALFGASAESDAYFAALALPLYVSNVLISAVAVVFVGAFVEQRTRSGRDQGDLIASSTLNLAVLVLVGLAAVGSIFAGPLLQWSAPGLESHTHVLAAALALVLWPSVVASGLVAVLTVLWHVEGRFTRVAGIALLGAGVNLGLIAVLAPRFGVTAVAAAWTASLVLQAVLLVPVFARRWRPSIDVRNPAILGLIVTVAPLVAANVFIRASTVLDRFLASDLPEGTLSELTYASRIAAALGIMIASGPATVILPRLAEDVAARDTAALGERVSQGLRTLTLVVAPVVMLTMALSLPATRLLLERGAFSRESAASVALLVSIYAPTVLVTGLAAVTAQALYALRATRLIATVGAAEGVAYILYTFLLARWLGAPGIALGFTIYSMGSLTWQLVYLRRVAPSATLRLLPVTLLAGSLAVTAGLVSWAVSGWTDVPLISLLTGGIAGGGLYAGGLALVLRRVKG